MLFRSNIKTEKEEKIIEEKDYPYVYATDNIWKSYNKTARFLIDYYDYIYDEENEELNENICYNHFCKVVEDEMVVGFLSNTNQFIPINEPVPLNLIEDNIKIIEHNNYLVSDNKSLLNNNQDNKRNNFIKRIKLETNFFNIFRNSVRILLSDYKNSFLTKKIKETSINNNLIYKEKIENIIGLLYELIGDNIIFLSKEEEIGRAHV